MNNKITRNEFNGICAEYTVHPGIALENDHIAAAIKSRDRAELRRILNEEF